VAVEFEHALRPVQLRRALVQLPAAQAARALAARALAARVPRARIVFIAEIGVLSIAEIDRVMAECIDAG